MRHRTFDHRVEKKNDSAAAKDSLRSDPKNAFHLHISLFDSIDIRCDSRSRQIQQSLNPPPDHSGQSALLPGLLTAITKHLSHLPPILPPELRLAYNEQEKVKAMRDRHDFSRSHGFSRS